MSTNTYVALKTTTVSGSSTTSVVFDLTGITGYTDLVIIAGNAGASGAVQPAIQFNSDTSSGSTNYSWTNVSGSGSSTTSVRNSSTPYVQIGYHDYWDTTNNYTGEWHIINYANSTTYKTVIGRGNNAGTGTGASVGLWRNTAPITSITIKPAYGASYILAGSTFTVYGIANADVGAYATGGIITQDANYYYHAFGNSSYFTPTRNLTADILVVAGGGGGASGGGGAGGVLGFASQSLTSGTGYSCTIGAGGAAGVGSSGGSSDPAASQGGNSQFASLTASVGGGKGARTYDDGDTAGGTGGSGGGGGASANITTTGGSATSGQGYAGGGNGGFNASPYIAGGGGGAGGAGGNGTSSTLAGIGGIGTNSNSNFTNLATALSVTGTGFNGYLAGGGGGASYGTGGTGGSAVAGGGNGGSGIAGVAGKPNTGGGGGGGGLATYGGNGGSGLIIVRYSK